MSQSSKASSQDLDLDEDSGHDSVDDINSPADERERIASLETAVAWIRQEVVSLWGSCRICWAPVQKPIVCEGELATGLWVGG